MKYFKVEAKRDAKKYKITKENFSEATKNVEPFEVKSKKDGKVLQYAICPNCLNPIKIVGLARKTKYAPYGKHAGKDIKDVADWNYRKYRFCPYAIKRNKDPIDEEDAITIIDDDAIELNELLKNNFDIVVSIICETLKFQGSINFWRKALESYKTNQVYCYPGLTEGNLPYVFIIRAVHLMNIYSQDFLPGTDLYNALSAHPHVTFIGDGEYKKLQNDGTYIDIQFRATMHRQKVKKDGEIKESFLFCVDDKQARQVLYEKEIIVDQNRFYNDIHNPKIERNKELLDLAKEVLHEKLHKQNAE